MRFEFKKKYSKTLIFLNKIKNALLFLKVLCYEIRKNHIENFSQKNRQ
jgi:hypothetical protein